jgi:hypothetical protein
MLVWLARPRCTYLLQPKMPIDPKLEPFKTLVGT